MPSSPRFDILSWVEFFGRSCVLIRDTGFHATTEDEFAAAFEQALSLKDKLAMRKRARESAKRFTEEEFVKGWLAVMERLVDLRIQLVKGKESI